LINKISQQPENCENRNDNDLVQAFLKKWWVESDFKAPNIVIVSGSDLLIKRMANNAQIIFCKEKKPKRIGL
jgi:hypothetical protein